MRSFDEKKVEVGMLDDGQNGYRGFGLSNDCSCTGGELVVRFFLFFFIYKASIPISLDSMEFIEAINDFGVVDSKPEFDDSVLADRFIGGSSAIFGDRWFGCGLDLLECATTSSSAVLMKVLLDEELNEDGDIDEEPVVQ